MPLSDAEFAAIRDDATKQIRGDIEWTQDQDHPAVEFRMPITSQAGYPLFVKGSWNYDAGTLSYTIVHEKTGRIYALDLGKDHRNPDGRYVGERHKHAWTEIHQAKVAYVPTDITSGVDGPIDVWRQFCAEAKVTHLGTMAPPPRTLFMQGDANASNVR